MPVLAPLSDSTAIRLITNFYGAKHRVYHGVSHLLEVMSLWEYAERAGLWSDPVSAGIALAFHDVCYDPQRTDNEEDSASMALGYVSLIGDQSEVSSGKADWICEAILATKRHTHDFETRDSDTARLLDIDLAGLGRPWKEYEFNSKLIRVEYTHLVDSEWYVNRRGFLIAMLARPSVYRMFPPPGSTEERAQANLQRELENVDRALAALPRARN